MNEYKVVVKHGETGERFERIIVAPNVRCPMAWADRVTVRYDREHGKQPQGTWYISITMDGNEV